MFPDDGILESIGQWERQMCETGTLRRIKAPMNAYVKATEQEKETHLRSPRLVCVEGRRSPAPEPHLVEVSRS